MIVINYLCISILEIYYVIYGVAGCNWKDPFKNEGESGENLEGKEMLVNTRTYLYRKLHSTDSLACENHKYDIFYELPKNLPASLEAPDGYIRYKIEVGLDTLVWKNEEQFQLDFTVDRIDNLNDFPDLKLGIHSEKIKTFCCLFCASAPLIMTLKLPCSGFTLSRE
jgi:hypothetical protein